MAKVVYFTRPPKPGSNPYPHPSTTTPSPPDSPARPNGILDPQSLVLEQQHSQSQSQSPGESHGYDSRQTQTATPLASSSRSADSTTAARAGTGIAGTETRTDTRIDEETETGTATRQPAPSAAQAALNRASRRQSSTSRIPRGGRLNFTKFETTDLSSCISFISTLISSSAAANKVPLQVMKKNVKIMATGGGAHLFYNRLKDELGVEVRREEEMECLVLGLGFVMEIPHEVFWYSDELVQAISHPTTTTSSLPLNPPPPTNPFPRPSPNPPQYSLSFDDHPTPAQFPCLLVNIGSGVSIIKIDDYGKFERISGTSLGGGTLWGLLSLLTGAKSFDG